MMRKTSIASICVAGLTVLNCVAGTPGLSGEQFFADASGADSANLGATDVKVASGVVNGAIGDPWKLTITSANSGNLVKTGYAGKILYTNIKLVKTGGTLGAGLTDPSGTSHSMVSGTCEFETTGTATTETVDYAFELRSTWNSDRTLVAGTYADTITMTYSLDV